MRLVNAYVMTNVKQRAFVHYSRRLVGSVRRSGSAGGFVVNGVKVTGTPGARGEGANAGGRHSAVMRGRAGATRALRTPVRRAPRPSRATPHAGRGASPAAAGHIA